MTEKKMTEQEMDNLRAKGWDFIPWGPNEWNWAKFATDGKCIAQGMDETFFEDMKA